MNKHDFRKFLQERNISEDQIEQFVSIAEKFEGSQSHTADGVRAFSAMLIEKGLNVLDNYRALALYGRFLGNKEIYVAVVELVDGVEALDNLYDKVGASVGKAQRDEIFKGIELPPLGTPSSHKPQVTQAVMARLESAVEPKTCKKLLADSLRDLRDKGFLDDRKKYRVCKDIDEFLEKQGQEFMAQLEQLKKDGELFFTQEVTAEVIEFVASHPEVRQGVREGNVLYEAKIPYMTVEYLAETDESLKKYYYCHCPWVRESLKAGDVQVSPTFCNCSAGFHKKRWEVIFDQPLRAEIVESVLLGDSWCKIAIYLPEHL